MESFSESPGRETNPEEIRKGVSKNPEEVETSDDITGNFLDDSGNISEDLQNGRNDEEVERNVTENDTTKDDSSDNPWDDPSDRDSNPSNHGNNPSNHRNEHSNHSDDLVDASMTEQEEAPSKGNSFFTSLEKDDLAAGDISNQMRRNSEYQGQDGKMTPKSCIFDLFQKSLQVLS